MTVFNVAFVQEFYRLKIGKNTSLLVGGSNNMVAITNSSDGTYELSIHTKKRKQYVQNKLLE